MEKIPMTPGGLAALNGELKQLKSVERPAIIKAIAEAREHGDLSENAEYHSAKEKQSFIEGRIKEIEGILSLAEVIDPILGLHDSVPGFDHHGVAILRIVGPWPDALALRIGEAIDIGVAEVVVAGEKCSAHR